MNVLYLSSEVAPYSKTGGLADVAGALPEALAARGLTVKVVTPLHASVPRQGLRRLEPLLKLRFPYGQELGAVHSATVGERHDIWFIDHPGYFERAGLYQQAGLDYPDNARRFAFFALAALSAAQRLGFTPDVVHLNDWQTGLAAPALSRGYQGTSLGKSRCLFTIHNLAYQGVFPKAVLAELGLPWELFTPDQLEFYDQVSFLKAGLAFSDAISTVSPRYAEEIQTLALGCGLDGFLAQRRARLHGILNGVDYRIWDPSRDPLLPAQYSDSELSGKARCQEALRHGLSLSPDGGPVFGVVSRFVAQKGMDLLLVALEQLLQEPSPFTVAVLGSGDPVLEAGFRALAARYPGRLGLRVGFDEPLAHLIEAGSDFFLMPSRYEPCGLNQMYSLRYGTLPVVRATGGLDDTVRDADEPDGNGLKFTADSSAALLATLRRALQLHASPERLLQLRRRGMRADFSWGASAARYEGLYRSLVNQRPFTLVEKP
jgi:starch synthase